MLRPKPAFARKVATSNPGFSRSTIGGTSLGCLLRAQACEAGWQPYRQHRCEQPSQTLSPGFQGPLTLGANWSIVVTFQKIFQVSWFSNANVESHKVPGI